jgi:hypothetical protein
MYGMSRDFAWSKFFRVNQPKWLLDDGWTSYFMVTGHIRRNIYQADYIRTNLIELGSVICLEYMVIGTSWSTTDIFDL